MASIHFARHAVATQPKALVTMHLHQIIEEKTYIYVFWPVSSVKYVENNQPDSTSKQQAELHVAKEPLFSSATEHYVVCFNKWMRYFEKPPWKEHKPFGLWAAMGCIMW